MNLLAAPTSRLLVSVKKILGQKIDSKKKIYGVHAPEVVSIAKGKARIKCDFGAKVSLSTAMKGSWGECNGASADGDLSTQVLTTASQSPLANRKMLALLHLSFAA